MKRPSRDSTDLYATLTDEEITLAVESVRAQTLPVSSPFPVGQKATFSGSEWCVDGRPWSEIMQQGLQLEVPVHPDPAPDADAFEALGLRGDGLVGNLEPLLQQLCQATARPVLLRARSLIQQQYHDVSMPTPSLTGGLGSDQLMALDIDPQVRRDREKKKNRRRKEEEEKKESCCLRAANVGVPIFVARCPACSWCSAPSRGWSI